MSTRIIQIPGINFDSGVSFPGPEEQTPAPAARELPDARLDMMSGWFVGCDDEAGEDAVFAQKFIAARIASNKQFDRFMDKQRSTARGILLEEHEAAKERCRKQQAVIDEVKKEIAAQQHEVHRLKGIAVRAEGVLEEKKQRVQQLSRFSSRQTEDKARAEQREAQATKSRAVAKHQAAQEVVNQLMFVKLRQEEAKLAELAAEELRISEVLAGRPALLRELGFVGRV